LLNITNLCVFEYDAEADSASENICYIYCKNMRNWIYQCDACKPYVPTMTCNQNKQLSTVTFRQKSHPPCFNP